MSRRKKENESGTSGHGVYGEGSVFQRKSDGRWVASIPLGNGKKKQQYFDTEREAERAKRKMLQELEQGMLITTRDQLFGDYLVQWLEVQRTVVKETTFSMYCTYMEFRVIPVLGHVKLQKLTGDMLQKMYTSWVKEGELSFNTIRLIHTIVKKALQDAVRVKKIAYNPAKDVTPPKEVRPTMHVLTPEQAKQLLDCARSSSVYIPILLAVMTGMRRGEILALHWQDVDLERRQLEVRYTLSYIYDPSLGHYKFVLGTPKSSSSHRLVRLPQMVCDALKEHQKLCVKASGAILS